LQAVNFFVVELSLDMTRGEIEQQLNKAKIPPDAEYVTKIEPNGQVKLIFAQSLYHEVIEQHLEKIFEESGELQV